MQGISGAAGLVRRAGIMARRALTEASRPAPGPQPPSSHERLVIAVGGEGAFLGFPEQARAGVARHGRILSAALGGQTRFHVVPHGTMDILVFAPTNLGALNPEHVFPYLDDVFGQASARALHAALVEYGASPALESALSLVRAEGEPVAGAPAVALSIAGWRDRTGTGIRTGLTGGAGPLQNGFMASTVLFALRDTPADARRALDRVARGFSARQARLTRLPGAVPEDCLVLDLAAGFATNDRGDLVGLAPPGGPAIPGACV